MTYENTTHRVNLTGGEISTILYVLEGYVQGSDEYHFNDDFTRDMDRIFAELESVTDNYFAQHEDDNDYAECVDHLVNTMEVNS